MRKLKKIVEQLRVTFYCGFQGDGVSKNSYRWNKWIKVPDNIDWPFWYWQCKWSLLLAEPRYMRQSSWNNRSIAWTMISLFKSIASFLQNFHWHWFKVKQKIVPLNRSQSTCVQDSLQTYTCKLLFILLLFL